MAIYAASFHLHQLRPKYEQLWTALEKAGAVEILESLWLLETSQTASSLRDALRKYIEKNDSVLVLEITARAAWAWYNIDTAGGEWLKKKCR
jgi:hypothetical protein